MKLGVRRLPKCFLSVPESSFEVDLFDLNRVESVRLHHFLVLRAVDCLGRLIIMCFGRAGAI